MSRSGRSPSPAGSRPPDLKASAAIRAASAFASSASALGRAASASTSSASISTAIAPTFTLASPAWALEPPRSLSDDELLRRLGALATLSRRVESVLVAHIAEVDARRLYLREACSSMFTYCVERLGLSEPEAYLRITAARASRAHPVLLEMLADGRLHLSGIARLAGHLTPDNRDAVLARAAHLRKRELEELIAELSPRPDLPALIRKLPGLVPELVAGLVPKRVAPLAALGPERAATQGELVPERVADRVELVPDRVELVPDRVELVPERVASGTAPAFQLEPASPAFAAATAAAPTERTTAVHSASVEPLAPARYKVQFTASAELREKLERLQDLMRGTVSDGDLATVIERAVTEKLERLEARRFGSPGKRGSVKASAAQPRAGGPGTTRHIPAAVRRAVRERDGGQCRFVDVQGRRCTERRWLEFHHRHPVGFGGGHSVENIALVCRAHNGHLAEIDYGRAGPRESAGSRSSASGT